jgi:hypothetical protein
MVAAPERRKVFKKTGLYHTRSTRLADRMTILEAEPIFECGLAGVTQAPKRNLNMRYAFTDAEWLLIAPAPNGAAMLLPTGWGFSRL